MSFKGRLSISRYTGGEKGEGITISVTDELSGVTFLEVEVDPATFGRAVTGASHLLCEITEFRPEPVGKVREMKVERVMVAKDWRNRAERAAEAVAQHESDGWKGRVGDAMNYHNLVSDGRTETHDCYAVTFTRFIAPPDEGS